jgi:hypothetical protein
MLLQYSSRKKQDDHVAQWPPRLATGFGCKIIEEIRGLISYITAKNIRVGADKSLAL